MSLRINTNIAALNAHAQLVLSDKAQSTSMAKLSSGYRINNAGDDASGLARANTLRANVKALNVASQNTVEGKAGLSIFEGQANQIEGILERMKELATKDGGGSAATAEFDKMIAEIDRIAEAGGTNAANTVTIQVGVTADAFSQVSVAIAAMSSSALSVNTATASTASLAAINTAIDTVSGILGDIGAGMNRLDFTYNNLQTLIVNTSAQESSIRDVDMAAEMVNFTKSQIMMQAGTAMLAQANTSSQNILTLFR
jgi:flagellin